MGNAWAGNIAQAGHLHIVAHQRSAMLRHHHHDDPTARFFQVGQEGVQLIEQHLRARLPGCGAGCARLARAVVQRDQVIEGGGARIAAFGAVIQPALHQLRVVEHRRTIERGQLRRDARLRHQRRLNIAKVAQLFQVVTEDIGMIHHQLLFKAQLRQVIKQITLLLRGLIEIAVRGLTAAGAQQTNPRRAAVAGRGVVVVQQNIEVLPQWMVAQLHRIDIGPGERADIDNQYIERLRIRRQRIGEMGDALFFRFIEAVQVSGQVGAGRRRRLSQPDNPYQKMLLVLGRNDADLLTAAQGIAQGDVLLRGQSSTIEEVKQLAARQPYDAPNWVRTDRATKFSELQQYENQLQADGIQPYPVSLTLNLPPDLFLVRARGINMDIAYRYTSPLQNDGSRLAIHLNNQFMQDYPLQVKSDNGKQLLHIPLVSGLQDNSASLTIPALRLGVVNQLRFDFDYATTIIGGSNGDRCETVTPVTNHVVVDGNSTIDFSGYRHYIQMPSLRAFANAGFPFSRLADLSQTLVLINAQPRADQVSALLNALGNIGAQTGFPALNVQITDDWSKAKTADADLLMIGDIPADLREDRRINLLVDAAKSWVKKPVRQAPLDDVTAPASDRAVASQTTIVSDGPMAAIVGFQSPFHDQRSVVALLADSPRAYQLLNDALLDSGKRAAIYGSAAIIRESGVNSLRVGDSYFVGHLPWWERMWHALATHPALMALFAVIVVVLVALMVWRLMRLVTRRRLGNEDDE